MTPEDIFVQDIHENCIIYEDTRYFRQLYSGRISGIPENLKHRELENLCIQHFFENFRQLYSGRISGIPENLKHRELENLCIQHFFDDDLEHLVHKEKWQIIIYLKPESLLLRFIKRIRKILIKELS